MAAPAPLLGQILIVPYTFAPHGWAFCDGSLLDISTNTALFSILGTTYGGDGRFKFGLPDLQGSVPLAPGVGPGLSQYDLGQTGGEETVTLLQTEMPQHNHTVPPPLASADERTTDHPGGAYPTVGGVYAATANSNAPMGADLLVQAGGNVAHNNLQPYLVLNYVIAIQGVFPSRP